MHSKSYPGIRPGNFYSGVGLDRADHLRGDEDWLAEALASAESLFVAIWRGKNLMLEAEEPSPLWLRGAELGGLRAAVDEALFLGFDGTAAMFAIDLSTVEAPESLPPIDGRGAFRDLRVVGPLLPRQEGAILAYARGLAHWHQRHRFCGVCGAPTQNRQAGHVRTCTRDSCGADHFPRTDPAVIMLVYDGDHCVLGRQKTWQPGMHSTLAGFVEPGESLEEAVAREVYEEAGLEVGDVAYHSSQPWPFPSSIMLGFHAAVRGGSLRINSDELADANWYSRDALKNSPEDETFRLPRRDSIARRLIEDWLAED